tara:strand:- start:12 stop:887 length:876 start_codon:yes stop_codon:yes gene_type:complete
MKTVNSVSGGQTSAYLMANYPADFNVFALVRINDPASAPKDPWIKKYVQEKLQTDFIATAEDDIIFYTLADLEQYTGQVITWVQNPSFDEVINSGGILPSALRRYCTSDMKVKPIAHWCYSNFNKPVEMRLGFRAGEDRRVQRGKEADDANGLRSEKIAVGKHPSGRTKWKTVQYAKMRYPLHEAGVFNDQVREFWKGKPVRFAERNNCVGCFHRNPILLNLIAKKFPEKYSWFIRQEEIGRAKKRKDGKPLTWNTWRQDGLYSEFKQHKTQLSLTDLDGFTDCDSGYCGL